MDYRIYSDYLTPFRIEFEAAQLCKIVIGAEET